MAGTTGQDTRKLYLNYLLLVPSPVVLQSSSTVIGPYSDAAAASVNLGTQTITVPHSAAVQFYRIRSDVTYSITSMNIVGPNVVITYN
jgi:hypothetical protein